MYFSALRRKSQVYRCTTKKEQTAKQVRVGLVLVSFLRCQGELLSRPLAELYQAYILPLHKTRLMPSH